MSTTTPTTTSTAAPTTTSTAAMTPGLSGRVGFTDGTPFWGPDFDALQREDPEIAAVVLGELDRLRGGLQLIASENFTSPAVLAALGSTLSNKYAEGYPGRRYYGGCGEVDKAELLGIARAKELFGAEHANLQPTAATAPTWPPTPPCCRPATPCWRCRCRMAATSPTAARSTSPASGSTPLGMACARTPS